MEALAAGQEVLGHVLMTATLRTACGCEREIDVYWPPQPYIVVPLVKRIWPIESAPMDQTLQRMRRFELDRLDGHWPCCHATYIEVVE